MKKERLIACVQTPPLPSRKKTEKSSFPEGGGGLYTGQETARGLRRNREKTNKQKLVSGFQSEF